MNVKIVPQMPKEPKKTRVAFYCRVSTGKDTMMHSLSAQVSYYNDMCGKHTDWEFNGIYADEAFTGTREERPEFQRMLRACENGEIDLIITKSVSRFARNTVTLLNITRELRMMGIGVFFEEQNLNTLNPEADFLLSVLASFSQEESRNVSENRKWRIRSDFKQGIPNAFTIYGYTIKKDVFTIVPDEAIIIKRIYSMYLSGMGIDAIVKTLNTEGVKNRGREWIRGTVHNILVNEKMCGDLMLQKCFVTDHITKYKKKNDGELPRYFIQDNHEPIIDRETFEKVQSEISRRACLHPESYENKRAYAYSGKIRCGICGHSFRRKMAPSSKNNIPVWICRTYAAQGKDVCASKRFREDILNELLDGMDFIKITAFPDDRLVVDLSDGTQKTIKYKNRSRSEAWTEEMKKEAKERAKCQK